MGGHPSSLSAVSLLSTLQTAVAIVPFSHFGEFKPFKDSVTLILPGYQVGVYVFIPLFLLGICVFNVENLLKRQAMRKKH